MRSSCSGSAAKVSDFIRTVRILKVSFYAYFMRIRIFRTVSLYVKYCRLRRIFGSFTVELRIFPERSWQHCSGNITILIFWCDNHTVQQFQTSLVIESIIMLLILGKLKVSVLPFSLNLENCLFNDSAVM